VPALVCRSTDAQQRGSRYIILRLAVWPSLRLAWWQPALQLFGLQACRALVAAGADLLRRNGKNRIPGSQLKVSFLKLTSFSSVQVAFCWPTAHCTWWLVFIAPAHSVSCAAIGWQSACPTVCSGPVCLGDAALFVFTLWHPSSIQSFNGTLLAYHWCRAPF
jgi:hypothetical protein